jgi:23S rRNA (uracil1939-C5)-methyltransferase
MMPMEAQVKIETVAFKGYGVTHLDGKVVFIPYAVTRDEGQVEIVEERKNYSMGRLKKILVPSPWRVEPLCPVFGQCGGCQWQHIDYAIQGELKKEILKEVLKRLGRLKELPSVGVASSPQSYDYRVRVQLKVKGKAIGYYQERSHKIVDIDHCPISHPLVNQIIRKLREEISLFSRMAEIEINVSPEEGKGVLLLHPLSFDRRMEDGLRELLQVHPVIKGCAVKQKGGLTLFNDPHLHFTTSLNRNGEKREIKFRTSPGSFYQVNLEQNRTLNRAVLQFLDVNENERVLDLYAGVGNFTLPLAVKAKEIIGIEENRTAVDDARFNAERNRIRNCDFIQGRVEDVLKRWKRESTDLILLDPPRMGCKMALDQMVRLRPKKIVYISCEPTTLSRDLRLFSERGYSLKGLALIDMFPQTYHMEVVALLTQPQVKV